MGEKCAKCNGPSSKRYDPYHCHVEAIRKLAEPKHPGDFSLDPSLIALDDDVDY